MSRSYLLVIAVALLSASMAWGFGKGKSKTDKAMSYFSPDSVAEKAEYSSALFSSHLSDVNRYMNAYLKQEQDTRAIEATKSKKEKQIAEEKARKSQAELFSTLKSDSDEITKNEIRLGELKGRLHELEEFTEQSDINQNELKKLKKEYDELDQFFKTNQRPTRKDPNTFSPRARDANAVLAKSLDEATAKKAAFDEKYKALESIINGEDKTKVEDVGFAKGINEDFNLMKKNYYDARILLTNFETLEARYKISGLRLEIMKAKVEEHLNKTLIGSYVTEQIKKSMAKICDLQKKCPVENGTIRASDDLMKQVTPITEQAGQQKQPAGANKAQQQ